MNIDQLTNKKQKKYNVQKFKLNLHIIIFYNRTKIIKLNPHYTKLKNNIIQILCHQQKAQTL